MFPAPAGRGDSRGSPPPPARAGAVPAGPADIRDPRQRRAGAGRTAHRGTPQGTRPAPAAARGRPGRHRGSAAPAKSTAALFAAAPMCGTETAPGLRPGWRGRSGRAAPALALPRAGAARRTLSARAGPDIPVHKSRCAPALPDNPPLPASGRPRPPCSPRRKALPPAAACRASGSRPRSPPSASRQRGCGRAVRRAAHRTPRPMLSSNGP